MPQKVRIIGVPMDLGQSRRGVDMGPSALRVAGLLPRLKQLGCQVDDIGNISVKQPEEQPYGEKRAKYLNEIAETCRILLQGIRDSDDGTDRSRAETRPISAETIEDAGPTRTS